MRNGTTLSRWFRLPNVEKESVADLSSWIVGAWSTQSFTWFAPAVRGECCQVILAPGKRSMATFVAGAKIGLGRLCMTRCEISCARSEEHTSELQSLAYLVCRLLLEKKKKD